MRRSVPGSRASDTRQVGCCDAGAASLRAALTPRPKRARKDRPQADALRTTFLPRYGGEVLYAGDGDTALVADDGQDWDMVRLVRYPTRRAFSAMVADPEYEQVTQLRSQALVEAVLQPSKPLA